MDPETKALIEDVAQEAANKAVEGALTKLGVDHQNPIEMQQDFARLREWRTSVDAIRRKGILTVVGVLVTGALAALWVGLGLSLGGSK